MRNLEKCKKIFDVYYMSRFAFFLNLFLVIFLTGCYPTIDSRGYNPETFDLAQIQVGIDTRQSVQEKLGSPSTISSFPSENQEYNWYYISKKTATTSFYHPETLEQQTLVITFDAQGIVRNVQKFQGEHPIVPVKRKTETTGYESSVMRDIFGNFGRYSSQKPKQP
jgi:outer membrane protein assembly factor BamE (lipoprotein component of BamABCDE complex)